MRIILNTFFILFVLLFAGFSCFSLIFANQSVTDAENFFDSVCQEVENSYFDPAAMNLCMEKAGEKGYKLTITDESKELYGEIIPAYSINMDYRLRVPMFNVSRDVSIEAFVN